MDKWKFEELLSEGTKANILNATKEWLEEEEQATTEEEIDNYINVYLGNSYWEMVKSIMNDDLEHVF